MSMRLLLSPKSIEDYQRFLKIKALPLYRFEGRTAIFPDEYASRLGLDAAEPKSVIYNPIGDLFDYQRDISGMAIEKRKFAVFADCGLGKTLIFLEFCRYVNEVLPKNKCILIISPLMVIPQTLQEIEKFYNGQISIRQVRANELSRWLNSGKERIGITNYDALTSDTPQGRLGALVLDESSMLKSQYGKWGTKCIELGRGLDWKLACTGTPAPNDRIEYANHAVFLDVFPTANSFFAKYFVNRGSKKEKWEIKPYGLQRFYQDISHWAIFLTNPSTYGWRDHSTDIPPIHVHIHQIGLTEEQKAIVGTRIKGLFASHGVGGITTRSMMSQIAKGWYNGRNIPTNKPSFIRRLVDSWPDESTIIWCIYNREQENLEKVFPEAASITGTMKHDERQILIEKFKAGKIKVLISKPKILGFGLNLHIATRQVFSGLQDSYESYYQAVKRSNRVGSVRPLNVHIPVTDIERPMVNNVLQKAGRVQMDTEEQERIFKNAFIRK